MIQQSCSRWMTAVAVLLTAALPASAGVVYEIEVKDHEQSPPKTETSQATAEGRNLKMAVASGGKGSQDEMIFRGDRREMVVVDHDRRTYHVMDEATMRQIAGAANSAMTQFEEMLKNVPADQRPVIEEMLKQKMPAQAAPTRALSELKKTGERAEKAGYPCVKYEVYRAGRKVRELWVTDWSNLEGGGEVADTFGEMADFFSELMDAMPKFGGGGPAADDNMWEHIRKMGGFPVVTRSFDDFGSLEDESTLRSARRQALDPDAFEPPSGYKRQEMFAPP